MWRRRRGLFPARGGGGYRAPRLAAARPTGAAATPSRGQCWGSRCARACCRLWGVAKRDEARGGGHLRGGPCCRPRVVPCGRRIRHSSAGGEKGGHRHPMRSSGRGGPRGAQAPERVGAVQLSGRRATAQQPPTGSLAAAAKVQEGQEEALALALDVGLHVGRGRGRGGGGRTGHWGRGPRGARRGWAGQGRRHGRATGHFWARRWDPGMLGRSPYNPGCPTGGAPLTRGGDGHGGGDGHLLRGRAAKKCGATQRQRRARPLLQRRQPRAPAHTARSRRICRRTQRAVAAAPDSACRGSSGAAQGPGTRLHDLNAHGRGHGGGHLLRGRTGRAGGGRDISTRGLAGRVAARDQGPMPSEAAVPSAHTGVYSQCDPEPPLSSPAP
jgi:hypothetical protein